MSSPTPAGLTVVQRARDWFRQISGPLAVSAVISSLAAVISAAAAAIAIWQAGKKSESDRYLEMRQVLIDLNYVETNALQSEDNAPCGPYGCMGSLAMREASFEQYQLLALNAYELAEQLDELESDTAVIASALYKCGQLDHSKRYATRLAQSQDAGVRFRATLLLAQIAYFRRESDEGDRQITRALSIVSEPDNKIPTVEQGVMRADAYLTQGRMRISMGDADGSRVSQEKAFYALQKLPDASRVMQLVNSLERLVIATTEPKRLEGMTFEEYQLHYEQAEYSDQSLIDAPESSILEVPAAPAAPTN